MEQEKPFDAKRAEQTETFLRDPEELEKIFLENLAGFNAEDRQRIATALDLAKKAHALQLRDEGDPYIVHPLRIAIDVARSAKPDANSIIKALLHDVIEDSGFTHENLKEKFGSDVADTVKSLSKNKELPRNEMFSEYHRRLATLSESDAKLKLLDRLDNLKSLRLQPRQDKRGRYIKQTEEHYLELAKRVDPEIYAEMVKLLQALKEEKR
jgi:GTP diphosphokinase / guanosine-3',5'-bis(diphosphate) 3'-diphosphatase